MIYFIQVIELLIIRVKESGDMKNEEKREKVDICHNEREGFFFCDVDGHRCVVEYEMKDNGATKDVFHTFVHPGCSGRGIAGELLKAVVDYAAERGKKIIPSCSYAVTYFRRHKEQQGLLAEGISVEDDGGSCRLPKIREA